MTDIRAAPTTLADVQKGDLVWVIPRIGESRQSRVDRVTKHQTILDGGDHYERHRGFALFDGLRVGYSSRIAVGPEAEKLKAEQHAERLRTTTAHDLGAPLHRLNQETITAKRAACCRAEAALRELGEWNEDV